MTRNWFSGMVCALLLAGCGGGGGGGSDAPSTPAPSGSTYTKIVQTGYIGNNEYPKLMAVDASGTFYVALTGADASVYNNGGHTDRVASFDSTIGSFSTSFTVGRPYGVTFDATGAMVVSAIPNGSYPGIYRKVSGSPSPVYNAVSNASYGGVWYDSNRIFWAAQSAGAVVSDGGSNYSLTQAPAGILVQQNVIYATRYNLTSSSTPPVCGVQKLDVANNNGSFQDFACSTQFNHPQGIAYSSQTNSFYVVNSGDPSTPSTGTVLRIDANGNVDSTPFLSGSDGLCSPVGALVVGNYLYVSNGPCATDSNHRGFILRVNLS